MKATQEKYPVFEANQVLTNEHLNQLFTYLDRQERLTRANLIGIGIVCGLEVRYDSAVQTIYLSKGCGITSEGYLVMQPEDAELVAYRKVTEDLTYPPFKNTNPLDPDPALNTQYDLWELFPKDEPNVKTIDTPANFLDEKAVLLFLELKNAKLRNCSPNNCDDKGAETVVRVRPLLIQLSYLLKIIAKENQLNTTITASELETALLSRLNLPDLRLPRYDVPNTNPATSNDVLAAFHAVFQTDQVVSNLGKALSAAYTAFKPILPQDSDPFASFTTTFGFLEQAPVNTNQVRFLPYYYDFIDDLIWGYDEFCRKGMALLCACCPPEGLFPRHLMAGLIVPKTNASVYRHSFRPSSAMGGCEAQEQEVRQLFQRLVEMIAQFATNPPLPTLPTGSPTDTQIRITPSKLSDAPLSEKAIPYYYGQTGATPLFQLWNAEKTRRNRAIQNLSYRSDEYVPAAPAFVTKPLRYDLESYNFLRIEGHLGKNYQSVLSTLLTLKTQYRLPIDILALRTGAFDENIPVDLSKEQARFQDLEALYDALREELLSALAEGTRALYETKTAKNNESAGEAKLSLLKKSPPTYHYVTNSVGFWYESNLTRMAAAPYIDVDQNNITASTIWFTVYCPLFASTVAPDPKFYPHIVSIFYFTKLAEILPESLDQLGFADFENKYQDLVGLTRYFRSEEAKKVPTDFEQFMPQEDLIDQFDRVLFACKLEPIRSIVEEYKRRLKEIKQKQFLSYFLQNNPGIQHKAGVPMGGTFILVYHDDPDPVIRDSIADVEALQDASFDLRAESLQNTAPIQSRVKRELLSKSLSRISKNRLLTEDEDIRLVLGTLIGVVPQRPIDRPPVQEDAVKKIIDAAVSELTDGTVIADFYLPYLYNSGATPVQFVLPKVKPSFTYEIGCTNEAGLAEVTLTPKGGIAPYSVKVDNEDYKPLDGVLSLPTGARKLVIQDAETTESNPQTIQIGQQLTLDEPQYVCSEDGGNTYVAAFSIQGGKGPYTASRGTVTNATYTSDTLPGDTDVDITITDSRSCTATKTVHHSCLPPLNFTIQTGCTNPNNEAPVTILPTGGTAPYQVQVDQGVPVAIEGPVMLAEGTHQFIVSDAVGAVTPVQSVAIPARITLTVDPAEYHCEDGKYQALVHIAGGTPPYFYVNTAGEKQPVNENVFATDPFPSGEEVTINVSDSNPANCEPASIPVKHTCEASEPPCNLPHGGQSQRCAYRLWLQPPAQEIFYKDYQQQSSVKLRYNGEDLPLQDASTLLRIDPQALTNDFNRAIGEAIANLNKAINQAITAKFGPIGRDYLQLTYEPDARDPFSIFWIEYFIKDEQTFDRFTIEFDYSFTKPNQLFDKIHVVYTSDPDVTQTVFRGTILDYRVREQTKQIRIPAFNCFEHNLCLGTAFESHCRPRDIQLSIQNAHGLVGGVTGIDPNDIAVWIWDFPQEEMREPFASGQRLTVTKVNGGFPKVNHLTIITADGCSFTVERIFQ